MKHNGVKEEEISVGAPQVSDFEADRYNTNKRTYRYNTSSTLTVTSRNVKLMRGIIARQGELLKQGVAVVNSGYYNSVKYEYVIIPGYETQNDAGSNKERGKDSRTVC